MESKDLAASIIQKAIDDLKIKFLNLSDEENCIDDEGDLFNPKLGLGLAIQIIESDSYFLTDSISKIYKKNYAENNNTKEFFSDFLKVSSLTQKILHEDIPYLKNMASMFEETYKITHPKQTKTINEEVGKICNRTDSLSRIFLNYLVFTLEELSQKNK